MVEPVDAVVERSEPGEVEVEEKVAIKFSISDVRGGGKGVTRFYSSNGCQHNRQVFKIPRADNWLMRPRRPVSDRIFCHKTGGAKIGGERWVRVFPQGADCRVLTSSSSSFWISRRVVWTASILLANSSTLLAKSSIRLFVSSILAERLLAKSSILLLVSSIRVDRLLLISSIRFCLSRLSLPKAT
jgi:hypothetical protein